MLWKLKFRDHRCELNLMDQLLIWCSACFKYYSSIRIERGNVRDSYFHKILVTNESISFFGNFKLQICQYNSSFLKRISLVDQ